MPRVRPAAIDIRLSFGRIWSTLTHHWGNGLMTDTAYVVFGANGGIGAAVSRRLAAAGAGLVLAGRSEEKLVKLASALDATACVLDATQADQVRACLETAVDRFGQLDGVVNCVGSLLLKPADRTTPEEFAEVISTNLGSAFAVVHSAAAVMRRSGGSVVLLSSAAAEVGLPNHEAIAAAKAGIIGLARSAAATYASRGLRFNCVAPGMVRTPLTESITASDVALKGSIAMHALGRIGEPEDIAAAVGFLLDPANNWLTGQVLGVDGGLAHVRARPRA